MGAEGSGRQVGPTRQAGAALQWDPRVGAGILPPAARVGLNEPHRENVEVGRPGGFSPSYYFSFSFPLFFSSFLFILFIPKLHFNFKFKFKSCAKLYSKYIVKFKVPLLEI